MAEGTYEYECMRAELLGIAKPDQEEFEKARSERLQQEQDEREAAEAKMLEEQDEALKGTGSKLDELTGILSSTQQKLNRFKQTACGSLTNIFSRTSSMDTAKSQLNEDTPNTSSRRNTTAANTSADINQALDNLDNMQHQEGQPVIPTEKIRQAKLDLDKKMTSHLDALDRMINKADQAEIAMHEQTKQMRKMAK
ncbi:uncharacterized protein LOC111691126 [Lucilia cuprina]|uniref:uncharacterized protein LOC111691126 n=1 Tax=Lucilia cuprina TaxID=7375 RepID=UPI001F061C1B|nr:uncharacterized protein LOC111691126 [Lucilia cuprina]